MSCLLAEHEVEVEIDFRVDPERGVDEDCIPCSESEIHFCLRSVEQRLNR